MTRGTVWLAAACAPSSFSRFTPPVYLAEPVANLEQAIMAVQPKAVLMHFIYDGISGEKLREAWREGFDSNTPSPSQDLRKRMARFVGLFNATSRKGDCILLA